jgi:hypothetical protein
VLKNSIPDVHVIEKILFNVQIDLTQMTCTHVAFTGVHSAWIPPLDYSIQPYGIGVRCIGKKASFLSLTCFVLFLLFEQGLPVRALFVFFYVYWKGAVFGIFMFVRFRMSLFDLCRGTQFLITSLFVCWCTYDE